MKSDLQDIDVIYQTQTERAVCVRIDETIDKDVWLPLSQCQFETPSGDTPRRGDMITLTAPERVLIEKGLV